MESNLLSLIHKKYPGATVVRVSGPKTLRRQIKRAKFFKANGIPVVLFIEDLDTVFKRHDPDTVAEMLEDVVLYEKEKTDEGAGNQAD